MTSVSCVSCDLTASHDLPVKQAPHAHKWTVTIYWPSEPWIDARLMRMGLDDFLRPMQGQHLSGMTHEHLARAALKIRDVVRVKVWRDDERMGCEVSR